MTRCFGLILALGLSASAPHITPTVADELRHREPAYLAAPPGHPFASLDQGMGIGEVRAVAGKPTSLQRVATLWTYVPF